MATRAIKQIFFLALSAAIVAALFMGFRFYQFQHAPLSLGAESVDFTIESGNSIRQIAQKLANRGYIDDPLLFIILARLKGDETRIKAGEYRLLDSFTPLDTLDQFRKGNSIVYSFTIIEGWTFRQLLTALHQDPILKPTLDPRDTEAIMAQISHGQEHPEGRFLPDTYHFPRGTTDLSFLKRAYHSMQQVLKQEWDNRAAGLPLNTPYEALILASIIEKETGAAFERPLIAAAFIERIKRGMRLQTDPTIIYGLGDAFDGNIRYADLRLDTPYNTYLHRGLTPTPIALPGRDAIRAALNPADSDAIYFVSKGDGTHQFSSTLEEHNAAVSKYQLKGRKPQRKAEPG